MFQYDIISSLSQLVISIIVSIVTSQAECVALYHLDMAKSLKRIGSFIEMGTVAIQVCPIMAKMHMTIKNLSIPITILVIMKIVGMNKIHSLILNLLSRSTFLGWLSSKCKSQHHESNDYRQEPFHLLLLSYHYLTTVLPLSSFYLTQPSYSKSQSR